MNLIDAIRSPELFAPFFRQPDTWSAWLVVLKAIFGLPMDEGERALFCRCTGRSEPFAGPVTEGWLVCGRRAGKSFIAALVAAYLAAFRDYRAYLSPGERGVVMVLAVDRDQARVILRYIAAFFDGVPALAELVVARTAESLDLANGISIEVHTSSFRSVRGRTLVAALADEIAFWRSDESRNPDREVLSALRPAMATIPNALLLCLSSPYARAGALFEAFEQHHGNDASDVLVWRAPTAVMNPTIASAVIRRAFERDPQAAAAEWEAEFRSDVEAFLEEAWIAGAVDVGCFERPPDKVRAHACFVDPSGGKKDSFTVAVAHRQGETAVLDLCREFRPPFDPASVVRELVALVKPYRVGSVTGDAYSGEWVQAEFRRAGLAYHVSARPRSDIYLETGPRLAQGRVRLLDHPRLITQLRQLERRTSPGGRDRVNHPPGGHDDVANAAMGAVWMVGQRNEQTMPTLIRHTREWDPCDRSTWPSGYLVRPSTIYRPSPAEQARGLRSQLSYLEVQLADYKEAGHERGQARTARRIDAMRRRVKALEGTA